MNVKRNVLWNLLLTSSSFIFPLITFPYITRILSRESMGKVFFIDSFTQYFIIFSSIGIPYYGLREIAKLKEEPALRSKLVLELVTIQASIALFLSVLFLLAYRFIPSLKGESTMIVLACLTTLGSSFVMEWFFQAIGNFKYVTNRTLLIKTISIFAILLFVRHSLDYEIYYGISALVVILNGIINTVFYWRLYHAHFNQKLTFRPHIKPLLILFSIHVAISIYTTLDTIILGMFTNPASVSLYNVPLKLVKMFWMVTGSIGLVLIPKVSQYFLDQNIEGIKAVLSKSLNVVFILTIPFGFFCMMFSGEILTIISGDKYLHAAPALRLLAFLPFIIGVCNVMGTQYLMPIGNENQILHATIAGLIVSLSCNFLLIPRIGFLGACIASLSAETVVCVYLIVSAIKHRINLLIDYSLLGHTLLSLGGSLIFMLAFRNFYKPFVLMGGTIGVYALFFIALQFLYFKNQFLFSIVKFNQ